MAGLDRDFVTLKTLIVFYLFGIIYTDTDNSTTHTTIFTFFKTHDW